ncbi:hypothetical protein OXPF_37330 [Oxobacter pfennigii]|uniref:Uncharacterized protein n=1 Tax=Oxobacter pfennigii TaxID=36849 RepID=A0A0P8W307_9CLOT|nr:hypothetical protein [Oxobacter pfennigii]KPU42964.1 hypothetical protein OXPF_37330 [Oxobacter pfennigii]
MLVKGDDMKKLEKLNAWFDVSFDSLELEVFAIAKFSKTIKYLLIIENSWPEWVDSRYFKVLDESVPIYWISNKYNFFFKLKNNKYDFSIPIRSYMGPPEFIENSEFLFDIYDNPSKAHEFSIKVIEKHKEK